MSSKLNTHTQAFPSTGGLLSVLAFPAVVAVGIARRIQERRELNELLSMGDHALHDIGLQRHEIDRAMFEPLWRR